MIDLTSLLSGVCDELSLDGEYVINKELIENSEIIEISKITIKDSIIKKKEDDFCIVMTIIGKMKIKDSVTLDEVWYPFKIEIDENLDEFLQNDEKSLDIIEFLWQNIVLEVPLRFTMVSDYSDYHGDGWKLVSEEELDNNNPFKTLLENEDRSD